jgi:glycosyltransferase involved in cell wall biosynthesis
MSHWFRHATRKLGIEVKRQPYAVPLKGVSLPTTAARTRGNVLISYIVEPFLHPERPVPSSHTHFGEAVIMARTFLDLGFNVDVIDYRNDIAEPRKRYDVFVGARENFERLTQYLPARCLKIAHLDTSHFLFNNQAAYARALALQQRRGTTCLSLRLLDKDKALEHADVGALLGNAVTAETYAYAGKPMHCLPGPAVTSYAFPEYKNYDTCRRRFLWFGSKGFVHKGLDLALEVFATLPDYELWICGPIAEDATFQNIYRHELRECPNIHVLGWVDVTSPRFLEVAQQCLALVFPSCAEGLSVSSVTCMHAGMIPMLTRETGVDVHDYGVLLRETTLEDIRHAVVALAQQPVAELERMTRAAWTYARVRHTRERYASEYRRMLEQLLGSRLSTSTPDSVRTDVPSGDGVYAQRVPA